MTGIARCSVPISEVCDVNPRLRKALDRDELVGFVGMADLDAQAAVASDADQRPYSEVAKAYTPFEDGDVLVAKITPCFENGKIAQARTTTPIAFGSTEFHVLRPHDGAVDHRYLLHFLRRDLVLKLGEVRMTGAGGQRRVPARLFDELEIPLPTIEEQRRIAALLDLADALRTKRRQVLAKLETLAQAIFIDTFGDPVVNPKQWPDDGVDGVLEFLTYGHRFYDDSYAEVGTPVVRITDLNEAGDLDFSGMPQMDLSEEERAKYRVRPGDMLFARSGATVGKVALIREGDPECIAGAYFVWMRFAEKIEPEYARAVLTSDRVRGLVARRSRQAAQQNFSGPAIRRLPMPVPPIELQRDFTKRVGSIRSQSVTHAQLSRTLDSLFVSLQQRAFRGEL